MRVLSTEPINDLLQTEETFSASLLWIIFFVSHVSLLWRLNRTEPFIVTQFKKNYESIYLRLTLETRTMNDGVKTIHLFIFLSISLVEFIEFYWPMLCINVSINVDKHSLMLSVFLLKCWINVTKHFTFSTSNNETREHLSVEASSKDLNAFPVTDVIMCNK